MADNIHHLHLVRELSRMLEPVFNKSSQAIYLYLDDEHKTCNQKFADLLGYTSIDEWVNNEYPVSDVSEEDRDKVIETYGNASKNYKASAIKAKVNKKDGTKINTEVIMVPLTYQGEVFVLHFITPKS